VSLDASTTVAPEDQPAAAAMSAVDVDVAEIEPAPRPRRDLGDDELVNAKATLAEALDALVNVLRTPDAVRSIPDVDRANLAKYLTIAKLRLENAIAIVRSGEMMD
jgi:hypothetical protein